MKIDLTKSQLNKIIEKLNLKYKEYNSDFAIGWSECVSELRKAINAELIPEQQQEKPAPVEWEPEACILNTDAQLSPDHTVNKINHNTDGIQLALDEVKKLKDEIVSSHNQLYNRIQGGERELENRIKQLEDKE